MTKHLFFHSTVRKTEAQRAFWDLTEHDKCSNPGCVDDSSGDKRAVQGNSCAKALWWECAQTSAPREPSEPDTEGQRGHFIGQGPVKCHAVKNWVFLF